MNSISTSEVGTLSRGHYVSVMYPHLFRIIGDALSSMFVYIYRFHSIVSHGGHTITLYPVMVPVPCERFCISPASLQRFLPRTRQAAALL